MACLRKDTRRAYYLWGGGEWNGQMIAATIVLSGNNPNQFRPFPFQCTDLTLTEVAQKCLMALW